MSLSGSFWLACEVDTRFPSAFWHLAYKSEYPEVYAYVGMDPQAILATLTTKVDPDLEAILVRNVPSFDLSEHYMCIHHDTNFISVLSWHDDINTLYNASHYHLIKHSMFESLTVLYQHGLSEPSLSSDLFHLMEIPVTVNNHLSLNVLVGTILEYGPTFPIRLAWRNVEAAETRTELIKYPQPGLTIFEYLIIHFTTLTFSLIERLNLSLRRLNTTHIIELIEHFMVTHPIFVNDLIPMLECVLESQSRHVKQVHPLDVHHRPEVDRYRI